MRIRIYFNRLADKPLIWSYDKGTQQTERKIRDWRLFGVQAAAGMDLTVEQGNTEKPRVWMDISDVQLLVVKDDVLHVYGYEAI